MLNARRRTYFTATLGLCALLPSLALAQNAPSDVAEAPEAPPPTEAAETGAKNVVVPPELIESPPLDYPLAAVAYESEGTVGIRLTVNKDGSVSDPEVIQSANPILDAAALKASLLLKFKPAVINGEVKAARIALPFEYRLPKPEAQSSPTDAEATLGNLTGQLWIRGTDIPLSGAKVKIEDEAGNQLELLSDAEGRFAFNDLTPGSYQVRSNVEGYLPLTQQESVSAGTETALVYRLSPRSDAIEVVVEGERPPREVTRRTIERREIQRIPGTSGDALRSIQSLPGVARPPGLAGLLIVRGSAPGDTQTFIDGSNVPLIYHFGGLSSVVPTEMLERIDFYPGNFSVQYGRGRGGIVDVGIRAPNTDCYGKGGAPLDKKGCYHGMAQVDLIDGRLMLSGPIPGADDWSFAAAGRRSWLDAWLKPVLEQAGTSVTSAPVYYDYQLVVERNKGPNDRLSFRFFGSSDRFESIITTPSATDPGFGGDLSLGTSFYRGQVYYKKKLTSEATFTGMLAAGKQVLDFKLGGSLDFQIESFPIEMRSELSYKLHPTVTVNTGLDFEITPFDVFVRAPPPTRPGEPSQGPLATQTPRESQAKGTSFRPAWYGDLEWQPSRRLRVVPGLRIDYARDTELADFSPRANFRYSLVEPEDGFWFGQPLKTVLKGGIGKFAQPPEFQETDEVFGTPGLQSNDSIHYSLGFEQGITEQIEWGVEGFYKDFYNSVARTPNEQGVFTYQNDGSGDVIGMESLLKYKPDEKFFGWVAYTLSRSRRRDCPTCDTRLFQYDQTHNVIILGSYRLGGGWELGARFRIVSGPLVTPTAQPPALPGIFSGDAGSYIAVQGEPFSQRLPLFHQMDLRLDKRWQFDWWQLSAYLDVQNVYNNAAYEALSYNYDFSQQAYQTGLPILPSIGIRGEF